jgi:hypothetical protein
MSLSAAVVQAYMDMLLRTHNQRRADGAADDTMVLSPLFYPSSANLLRGATGGTGAVEELLRLLRGGDARSEGMLARAARHKLLIIPVWMDALRTASAAGSGGSAHWALVVVFRVERLIECFDSRAGVGSHAFASGTASDAVYAARTSADAVLRVMRDGLPRLLGWNHDDFDDDNGSGGGGARAGAGVWKASVMPCAEAPSHADSGVYTLYSAQRVLAEQDVRVPPPRDFREHIRATLQGHVVG